MSKDQSNQLACFDEGPARNNFWLESSLIGENLRLRRMCARAEAAAARDAIMRRECDHRIKNSLQIIVGLLQIQARREANPQAKDALDVAASRVLSIANMHDLLQAGHGEDVVDISAMVEIMCRALQDMANDPGLARVQIRVRAQPIQGSVSLSQPLALVLNELVINALRHAFPNDRGGIVDVDLRVEGEHLILIVADDGEGLPENYAASGFGMRLMRAMTDQLGGFLKGENDRGARFTLSAPVEKHGDGIRPARTVDTDRADLN